MAHPTGNTFKPLHNPYIVGNPIKDAKMFFGREEDFAYISKGLSGSEQGGLIVLCGARRSGKTSVLFQILDGRLGDEFVPVLIDMQSMAIGNDTDFLEKLGRAILTAGEVSKLSPPEQYAVGDSSTPHVAFEGFVERITKRLGAKKLVLTFDEYELIETNIDSGIISERVLHLLSSLVEHHNVFVVFTGSDNLEARNRDYWSLFLSKARQKRISFLHHRDTIRLITEPLRDEVEYEEGVPERIAALTAGQPFYTQVLCRSIIDRLNDERKRIVGADDVRDVVDEVVENPLPQMIFHWNALSDMDKLALSIIAELNKAVVRSVGVRDIVDFAEKEAIGYRFDVGALNKSLETLFHGDLIVKESDEDTYSFKMGLWRRWVTRMHSVWQVVDELDRAGGPSADSGISVVVRAKPRRRFALAGVLAVVAAVVVIGLGTDWGRRGREAPVVDPGPSATIDVASTPPGATVYIDGNPVEMTPFDRPIPVPAGSLLVAAVLRDHERYEGWVYIEADDTLRLDIAMVPLTGQLHVTSEPPGAAIVVDGASIGLQTPDTVTMTVTEVHAVSLRMSGFLAREFPGVRVYADSVWTLHHDFARPTGLVRIASTPRGAGISLDGRPLGETTPFTQTGVPFGLHRVGMRLDGYADTTVSVETRRAEELVEVTLRRLPPGFILFQIPGSGSVTVDGKLEEEGLVFKRLKLQSGRREITVTNPAGVSKSRVHVVRPGVTDTLRFEFP